MFVDCSHCRWRIHADDGGRLPPWCHKCGADLKGKYAKETNENIPLTPDPLPDSETVVDAVDDDAIPTPVPSAAIRSSPTPVAEPAGRMVLAEPPSAKPVERPGRRVNVPQPSTSPPTSPHEPRLRDLLPQEEDDYTTPARILAVVCIFVCALIPLWGLGKLIPSVLGVGGMVSCGSLARNRALDARSRLAGCLFTAVGAWIAAIVLADGGLWLVQ
jgi:hypothetical protein